jgi:hypothetical protein
MRQGKDDVIVFYRQQLLHAGLYPLLFFQCTTAGTMPVSATMVLILYMATLFIAAFVNVIAKL